MKVENPMTLSSLEVALLRALRHEADANAELHEINLRDAMTKRAPGPFGELTGRGVKLAAALRRISDPADNLGGNLRSDFAAAVLRELSLGALDDGPAGGHGH